MTNKFTLLDLYFNTFWSHSTHSGFNFMKSAKKTSLSEGNLWELSEGRYRDEIELRLQRIGGDEESAKGEKRQY